jgi:outer membrane immunogenic protein
MQLIRNWNMQMSNKIVQTKACLLALIGLGSPALAQDWSGFYAGGTLNYDQIEVNDLTYGDGPVDLDGAGIGIFAGYNLQSGNLVYGAEVMAATHSGEGDDGDFLVPASAEWSLGLRGRVGFVTGRMLPYLSVGLTRTAWEADHEGNGLAEDIWGDKANGTSIALGVDWSMGERSLVRFEVERTRYGENEINFYGDDIHEYDMDATRVSVGYALQF